MFLNRIFSVFFYTQVAFLFGIYLCLGTGSAYASDDVTPADVNCDGVVNVHDAIAVVSVILGLSDAVSCEAPEAACVGDTVAIIDGACEAVFDNGSIGNALIHPDDCPNMFDFGCDFGSGEVWTGLNCASIVDPNDCPEIVDPDDCPQVIDPDVCPNIIDPDGCLQLIVPDPIQ